MKGNLRKTLILLAIASFAAVIAWAVDAFLAQTDKIALGAADLGAKNELVNIEITAINPGGHESFDWAKVEKQKALLEKNTREYESLVAKAAAEKQTGALSEATSNTGLASASEFHQMSEELATIYKDQFPLRAKTASETGKTRLRNAQMAFSHLETDTIDSFRLQSASMFKAATASLEEMKDSTNPKAPFILGEIALRLQKDYMKQMHFLMKEINGIISEFVNSHMEDAQSRMKDAIKKMERVNPKAAKMMEEDLKKNKNMFAEMQENQMAENERHFDEIERMQDAQLQQMQAMREGTLDPSKVDPFAGMSDETKRQLREASKKMGLPVPEDYNFSNPKLREEARKKLEETMRGRLGEQKKQQEKALQALKNNPYVPKETLEFMEMSSELMPSEQDLEAMKNDPRKNIGFAKKQLELMKRSAEFQRKQNRQHQQMRESAIKKDPKMKLLDSLQALMGDMQNNMSDFSIKMMEISIALQERALEQKP